MTKVSRREYERLLQQAAERAALQHPNHRILPGKPIWLQRAQNGQTRLVRDETTMTGMVL